MRARYQISWSAYLSYHFSRVDAILLSFQRVNKQKIGFSPLQTLHVLVMLFQL
jgi:hypothetical protein